MFDTFQSRLVPFATCAGRIRALTIRRKGAESLWFPSMDAYRPTGGAHIGNEGCQYQLLDKCLSNQTGSGVGKADSKGFSSLRVCEKEAVLMKIMLSF